jgi:hypothetical protein
VPLGFEGNLVFFPFLCHELEGLHIRPLWRTTRAPSLVSPTVIHHLQIQS